MNELYKSNINHLKFEEIVVIITYYIFLLVYNLISYRIMKIRMNIVDFV